MKSVFLAALCAVTVFSGVASAGQGQVYETSKNAIAFGSRPLFTSPALSPEGHRMAFVTAIKSDLPVLVVLDFDTGKLTPVVSSKPGGYTIDSCQWANEERLLCNVSELSRQAGTLLPYIRQSAVNADGSQMLALDIRGYGRLQEEWRLVDILPDDPRHVLIMRPSGAGVMLNRLDIYDNKMESPETGQEEVSSWMTDGRGHIVLRQLSFKKGIYWQYRPTEKDDWKTFEHTDYEDYEQRVTRNIDFIPLGFDETPGELLFLRDYNGHRALWSRNLMSGDSGHVVFSNDQFDIAGVSRLGKYARPISVDFSGERTMAHYLDTDVERIVASIAPHFPGMSITVLSESWDRHFYLIEVGGDAQPDAYFRFDARTKTLASIAGAYPQLDKVSLSTMQPITYKAGDGATVSGYLTIPSGMSPQGLPLVVLPHGGPQARDQWGFDPLVQFLAAEGYAVFQANFRGSGGFGKDWVGEGGFRGWEKAVGDITDGVNDLVAKGIVDPKRLAIVGWSYGGYIALLSAIQHPELYKCVTSIAGVTDPKTEIEANRAYTRFDAIRIVIGSDDQNVMTRGSPLGRAGEIAVPVQLFHGNSDLNASVKNSQNLARMLERLKKPVSYIEYDGAQHSILESTYRIDMFARISTFLKSNIGN